MSINYVISYTFSPGTTISSSQVNTNFSDNANTWTGLEGLTKSFSNLRVDATPTSATDVSIKSYVDKLNAYRRPVLQFGSITTVAVESGLDGTSGDIPLLFPDGTLRTETSTTRTTFDITRNAVLVTSGAQSGLTGATTEATNTWYALYGVKITDASTTWVTVGSTVLPLQANYATLNTAYGTNGWVYLGMIRNGDNSGTTGDILKFVQTGHMTLFRNGCVAVNSSGGPNAEGTFLAGATNNTVSTYTYSAGTGTTNIPNHLSVLKIISNINAGGAGHVSMVLGNTEFDITGSSSYLQFPNWVCVLDNITLNGPAASNYNIYLAGFVDGVLGIGANPRL